MDIKNNIIVILCQLFLLSVNHWSGCAFLLPIKF